MAVKQKAGPYFLEGKYIIYYQDSIFFGRIELWLSGGEKTNLFWKVDIVNDVSFKVNLLVAVE